MTVAVVVGVLVLFGILLVLPRVDVHNPLLTLFRVLVPSWRFFDGVSAHPTLTVRIAEPGTDAFGPWTTLLPPPRHHWWHVVWNPAGNLSFASHSLLGRLRSDLEELDPDDDRPDDAQRDAADLVSYQLVVNLVRWWLRSRAGTGARVQFRLTDGLPVAGIEPYEYLVSLVHEV